MGQTNANVRWFSELGMADLEQVGGKNASLGEMVSNLSDLGVQVPDGFATTSDAYHRFIGDTGLAERISGLLDGLDTDDVRRLAEVGKEIRAAVVEQEFPEDLDADIREAYDRLVEESRTGDVVRRTVVAPPRRTCRTRRSPASRRPSSTCAASTRSCTRSGRSTPPSTTTGPSPTASTTASPTATSACRRACSGWCAPTSARPA